MSTFPPRECISRSVPTSERTATHVERVALSIEAPSESCTFGANFEQARERRFRPKVGDFEPPLRGCGRAVAVRADLWCPGPARPSSQADGRRARGCTGTEGLAQNDLGFGLVMSGRLPSALVGALPSGHTGPLKAVRGRPDICGPPQRRGGAPSLCDGSTLGRHDSPNVGEKSPSGASHLATFAFPLVVGEAWHAGCFDQIGRAHV